MNEQVQYTLSLKDLFTGKLRQADDAVNRFEGTLGKAQSAAMSLAGAVGIAFGTAAVVGFGQKMIEAGTTVEDALVGLTTLLKDKSAAQQVINQTMEDAAKTPFAFEGLLAANKALISAGISADNARADVLNLANAIAATGGTDVELQRMVVNLQGVATLGKAMGKDINQFAFAGINIYKVLADATGQPIEKIQDMEISYEMLTMALRKAGEAGGMFENGLVNMANNTSIKISGLGDNVFKLSAQMFMDLKPAIDSIISGLYSFIDILTIGWNWLVRNKDIISALAIGIGVLYGATKLYQATLVIQYMWMMRTVIAESLMATAKGYLAAVTGVLTGAQMALNAAMAANPIGLIVTGIAVLTAGVIFAYQQFGTFRAVLWGVWGTIKAWAALVVDVFQNVWKVVKGVMTFDAAMITEGFKGTANAYMDAGKRLAQGFKDGYDSGMKDFAADQAKKTVAAPKTIQTAAQAGGKKNADALVPTKTETKGAQGQKAITMTVNIGSLIKDFKISTTNIQEGTAKIREMVAQALINATNDSQLIAGS